MEEQKKKQELKWKVGHDGDSRPMILGPSNTMYSISKFMRGKWQAFADEEWACRLLCEKLNELEASTGDPHLKEQSKMNIIAVHNRLFERTETAYQTCMDIQDQCSSLRTMLTDTVNKTDMGGVKIECEDAIRHLMKAEWLLDYIRGSLKHAGQALAMRDEKGEIS